MTSTGFNIGEIVEVLCDHKRNNRRIRDWVEGVVVHADDRMIAIQFRTDVYLTDGWMIPDRILWFNKETDKIRSKKNRNHSTVPKPKMSSHPDRGVHPAAKKKQIITNPLRRKISTK
jgi:hypothetical protein